MSPKQSTLQRIVILMLGAAVIFSSLILRLYFLQVVRAPGMREVSQKARTYVYKVPATRGYILDRHLKPLALNSRSERYTVTVDKRKIKETETGGKDIAGTVQKVGEILGLSPVEVQRHTAFLSRDTVTAREVKRGISDDEKLALTAAGLPGVTVKPEAVRFYPEGTLASHVVGYTGSDNKGLGGLEYALNDKLEGKNITIVSRTDIKRKFIPDEDITKNFKRGADVVLTVDSYIQHIVEREVKKLYVENEAVQVNAVVMHPKSGEILAMANYPTFDPNIYSASPEFTKNTCITDAFEPGSILKPFTVLAALDRGTVTPETPFDCEGGNYYFRGHTIRDDIHHFDVLSVRDILMRSSNIGTVKIALTLGKDYKEQAAVLYDYYRRFGFKTFGDPRSSDLPGESVGVMRPLAGLYPADIGAIPFGQSIMTNTLVLSAAYSALANRGLYVAPHIIKQYQSKEGYYYTPERTPPTRVVSQEMVEKVVEMMVGVTEDPEGTGYNHVRIPGFHIAGKTGTAQKVNPETGTYGYRMRISSFAGFFPAEDPEACIVVVVNEPRGKKKYGGEIAGPAWRTIAEELIAYWGLSPTVIDDPVLLAETTKNTKPEVKKAKEEPAAAAKTFGVNHIQPMPMQPVFEKTPDRMPNLEGLTIRDAYIALTMNGLSARFEGAGKVVRQAIAPGTVLDGTQDVGAVVCEPVLTDSSVPPVSPQLVQADRIK